MIPNKVCPVVFRTHGAVREILAFDHPEAGCQLVKGTIEPNESIEVAALRELAEETGLTGARITRHLGLWVAQPGDQVWAFVECSVASPLADSWAHDVRDDGGHTFNFFWHPLGQQPDAKRWHRLFRDALAFLERPMAGISDVNEADVVERLGRDVVSTLGHEHLSVVRTAAHHHRPFAHDPASYADRVVQDVQQYFHDCFIDTTWPACPNHPNHPIWFEDGWWRADGQPVARLGELGSLRK